MSKPAPQPSRSLRDIILQADDCDDASSDWRRWSLNKAERERDHLPELDAWLSGSEQRIGAWLSQAVQSKRLVDPAYRPGDPVTRASVCARLAAKYNVGADQLGEVSCTFVDGLLRAWALDAADSKPPAAPDATAHTEDSGPPAPATRRDARARWLAEAMLLVRDHPDWSDRRIAECVGRNPGTLTRSKEYQAAAKMARGHRDQIVQGFIERDPDTGHTDVEAFSDEDS